jgi:hypothetical protein
MKQSERLNGAREVACLLSNLTLARSSLVSQEAHYSQNETKQQCRTGNFNHTEEGLE